jgi:peroxiredoxin Q/BCP
MKTLSTLIGFAALFVFGLAPTLAAAPAAGDDAPDFSMTGTDGKKHSLADFKDKQAVVIAWFPKADTPG